MSPASTANRVSERELLVDKARGIRSWGKGSWGFVDVEMTWARSGGLPKIDVGANLRLIRQLDVRMKLVGNIVL